MSATVLDFLATSSIPDIKWFVERIVKSFVNGPDQWNLELSAPRSQVKHHISKFGSSCISEHITINKEQHIVLFPNFLPEEVEAFPLSCLSFLVCGFLLAMRDGPFVGEPRSRLRCKLAICQVLELLYYELVCALRSFNEEDSATSSTIHHFQRLIVTQLSSAPRTSSHLASLGFDSPNRTIDPDSPLRRFLPNMSTKQESLTPLSPCEVITQTATTAFEDREVTIVLPCAGSPSPFPNHKPKWLLSQPNGRPMFVDAISLLDLNYTRRIVIGVLNSDLKKYCAGEASGLLKAFEGCHPLIQHVEITVVIIPTETVDQVQTIQYILQAAKVTGPVFIKGHDSQFNCCVLPGNGVATLKISEAVKTLYAPSEKSYVCLDAAGHITNIAEGKILGESICVGGYAMQSALELLELITYARDLQTIISESNVELGASDLIWLKVSSWVKPTQVSHFSAIPVTQYEDWETLEAWSSFLRTFKTLFIDIDGTLFYSSGQYFPPKWGSTEPIHANVKHLQKLRKQGRVQIILTTGRSEEFRVVTERQLRDNNVPYDNIIFGLLHARRILINDYANGNKFPSAVALNLGRNREELPELLSS